MANLIKKKLVQELARFTKNLNPDSIKISSLKGEGELPSLELDAEFLTAVLQLPAWIKISKVVCSNIKIKIYWTKVKSEPLHITMSDVDVYVETCEEYQVREDPKMKSSPHDYGLIDKVIDGLWLTVSNVNVHFKSPGFNSDLEISEVDMRSVDKEFRVARLEDTRYVNKAQTTTTTRKLISWNSLRIQANADSVGGGSADEELSVSPILLITNQSCIQLTLTKRLADCVMVATRLEVRFDTFLWVLTSSQLFAAAMFARTLSLLVQRVTRQKREAAAKSEVSYRYGGEDEVDKDLAHGISASHHLRLGILELQLCDDQTGGSSNRGASMQLLLRGLALDFYPNRAAWSQHQERAMRNEYTAKCQSWITTLLQRYSWEGQLQMGHAPDSPEHRRASGNFVVHPLYLRENWLIASLRDIKIGCVSTGKTEHLPEALFQSSKKDLHIPDSQPAFQFEYTSYFYEPAKPEFCVPWPHVYGWVNPIQVIFHEPSLLWMLNLSGTMAKHVNSFIRTLPSELFEEADEEAEKDIRLEFIMPKVTLPVSGSTADLSPSAVYPHALQFQAARLTATNCGYQGTQSTRTEVSIKSQSFQAMSFFTPDGKFPYRPGDLSCLPSFTNETACTVGETTEDTSQSGDLGSVRPPSGPASPTPSILSSSQGKPPLIWNIHTDQCWLDFLYKSASSDKDKNIPFVGSLPVDLWICAISATEGHPGRLHVLFQSTAELQVLLERAELLWLLSLRDELKTLHSTILAMFLEPAQVAESTSGKASASAEPLDKSDDPLDAGDEEKAGSEQQTLVAVSLQNGIRVSLLLPNPESRHRLVAGRVGSVSSLLGGQLSSLLPNAVFSAPTPSPPPPGVSVVELPEYGHIMDDTASLGGVSLDSSLGDASSLLGDSSQYPSTDGASQASLQPNRDSPVQSGSGDTGPGSALAPALKTASGSLTQSGESAASSSVSPGEGDSRIYVNRPDLRKVIDGDSCSRVSFDSGAQQQELASLFHVSVSPVLADVQVADECTTVIVAARKPHIAMQSLKSATQLRKFVSGGISKEAVHSDDLSDYQGRILARVSLGKSVVKEAAEVGVINDKSSDELLFGLVCAEARDVRASVHERYLELLGAFFKLPPSDGTLPLHVEAVNCDFTIEQRPRPNGTQPAPTCASISDAMVTCMPSGKWVIGKLLETEESDREAAQSPSAEASVTELQQRNHALTENRSLIGSQLANCRLALQQASLERDALLQTIMRLQDELTKSNIAQDELHSALFQSQTQLKQFTQ